MQPRHDIYDPRLLTPEVKTFPGPAPSAGQASGASSNGESRLNGRRLRLSPSRSMVLDVLHYWRKIPTQAVSRDCRLGRVATARKLGDGRSIGWPALFVRAYAILSCRHPMLRRCYMTWPWAHLYEHPHPVGRMTVSRRHAREDRVFFAHIGRPDLMSAAEIQDWVEGVKLAPIESIVKFRQQVTFSKLPTFLRRLIWWGTMNLSGRIRANLCGTFALTTVGSAGATMPHPPSISAMTLTFGPIDEGGNVCVTMAYDHRLFDGLHVAGFLSELEEILNSDVADELAALGSGYGPNAPR